MRFSAIDKQHFFSKNTQTYLIKKFVAHHNVNKVHCMQNDNFCFVNRLSFTLIHSVTICHGKRLCIISVHKSDWFSASLSRDVLTTKNCRYHSALGFSKIAETWPPENEK